MNGVWLVRLAGVSRWQPIIRDLSALARLEWHKVRCEFERGLTSHFDRHYRTTECWWHFTARFGQVNDEAYFLLVFTPHSVDLRLIAVGALLPRICNFAIIHCQILLHHVWFGNFIEFWDFFELETHENFFFNFEKVASLVLKIHQALSTWQIHIDSILKIVDCTVLQR